MLLLGEKMKDFLHKDLFEISSNPKATTNNAMSYSYVEDLNRILMEIHH